MNINLYAHGGSGNHGCEALARTISSMLKEYGAVTLFTKQPDEDRRYIGEDLPLNLVQCGSPLSKKSLMGIISSFRIKYMHQPYAFVRPAYATLLKKSDKNTIAVSIGGDNYCYDGFPQVLSIVNKGLKQKNSKTVLFGCSIEAKVLEDKNVVEDLSQYDLITARENITYQALMDAGVKTKIVLAADPAFTLPVGKVKHLRGFSPGQTVGINLSPLVLEWSKNGQSLFKAYCGLINHIIETTELQVALIPHVVWDSNDDRKPLQKLFELYEETGRVVMIPDGNATELKAYISQCRFFIGARTHATIAAYSTCVPTVVVGYSVKSRGIAQDIFGTDQNYVVNINEITRSDALGDAFIWLQKNESEIRQKLAYKMPEYIETAYKAKEAIFHL